MKKNIIILGALAISSMAFSQVGINTETPKTTLDVKGKTDSGGTVLSTDITGMQAPRLTRLELTNKGNSLYGTDQTGAIIYITDISGGDNTGTQRANVTATGYYYFDGNAWQKISNGTLPTGIDTTNDAFVNDAANSMVKLDTKSDGSSSRANGEKFVIKDTGFLGLGTESPTNRIEIVGTGGADDNIGLTSYADGSGDAVVRFRKATGTASTPGVLTASSNLGTIEFRGYDGTDFLTRARITSYTSNSGTFATGSVPSDLAFLTGSTTIEERMRILSNGNVGIGTLSPTVKLDVNGKINAVDEVFVKKSASEGGQIKLQGQNATDADWTIDQINNLSTSRFRIFPGTDETNGLTITESGKVGVNMTLPNAKLDIRTNPTSTSNPGEGMFGLGSTTTAANTAGAGAMRYNTSSGGILQYSNGTAWNTLTSTAQKSIVVGRRWTSGQTVSNNGSVTLDSWTEMTDTNGNFNPSSGVFVAPRTGNYTVSATIGFQVANNYSGWVECWINVNGTSTRYKSSTAAVSNGNNITPGASITMTLPLTAGDQVTIGVYNATGNSRTIRGSLNTDDQGFNNVSIIEN